MSASTENPSISVLIPVFNCERYLGAAIESVLAQTLSPTEIIVVDDGSTDGTANIATSFGSRVRYEFRPHAGIPTTRNACIETARGDWLAFLDADDLWLPEKLRAQADLMLARPELQFTLTYVQLFLEPGCGMPRGYLSEWFESARMCGWLSSFLGRKSIFGIVGGFDTTLPLCEDVDWFSRAKHLNAPMAHLERGLLRKRVHDRNNSNNVDRNKALLLQAAKRNLDRKRHE